MLVVFITGCTQNGNVTSGNPDGLHITFLQPKDGDIIKEDSPFYINFDLYNGADFDIELDLCLSDGFGGTRSAVKDDCRFYVIEKKGWYENKEDLLFGDYQYSDIVSEPNVLEANLYAEAFYPVLITVSPSVCVRQMILRDEGEEECKRKETLTVSTQGFISAPITVNKIEKTLNSYGSGVKADLRIYLKKMSQGRIEGFINVDLYYGVGELGCDDLDKLDWDEKDTEKIINCWILIENMEGSFYDNPLDISLSYEYYQKESVHFSIVDSTDSGWGL